MAGRPSKFAAVVYEENKVLESMIVSHAEAIDPTETLFAKKEKALTPKKHKRVYLDSSLEMSPFPNPQKITKDYSQIAFGQTISKGHKVSRQFLL